MELIEARFKWWAGRRRGRRRELSEKWNRQQEMWVKQQPDFLHHWPDSKPLDLLAAWVTGSIKNDADPGGPEICPDWEVHVRNIVKQSGDLDIFWRVNKRINLPGDQLDLGCCALFFFLSMQISIMFILLNEILKKWCPSLCRFGCCAEQCKDFIQIWDQCSIQHVSLRAESLTGILASRCNPYP